MLFPVRFTFSFSKRLPLCLIWRFWSADRFIYSAAGKGPLHSFARGDKATADCHPNTMLNTFPQTCRAQTEESQCWYSASFMLFPFSCFHLVKENVYPAALLLIRGHWPRGAGETETEGERLLCSMRGIHRVLNWDIVTSGYCFSKNWMFSYSRHLPPTGCYVAHTHTHKISSQTQVLTCKHTHKKEKFLHVQYWSRRDHTPVLQRPCYHSSPSFILWEIKVVCTRVLAAILISLFSNVLSDIFPFCFQFMRTL